VQVICEEDEGNEEELARKKALREETEGRSLITIFFCGEKDPKSRLRVLELLLYFIISRKVFMLKENYLKKQ